MRQYNLHTINTHRTALVGAGTLRRIRTEDTALPTIIRKLLGRENKQRAFGTLRTRCHERVEVRVAWCCTESGDLGDLAESGDRMRGCRPRPTDLALVLRRLLRADIGRVGCLRRDSSFLSEPLSLRSLLSRFGVVGLDEPGEL